MDVRRASEIAASPVMASVSYNGRKIYIQKVNERNRTASIYPLNEPENIQEVSVTTLLEE